jgi:hypothetical protein
MLALVLGIGLTGRMAAAGTFEFNLSPGPAEQTLNTFARQSRMQVIFPTELAQGVQTNGVRGAYTVREALDRLLAGSALTAQVDETARTIAIAKVAVRREEIVQLPPYIVDADTVTWRYARVGEIELLSSCVDDVTKRVLEQVQRLHEALGLILAPEFLVRSDVPTIYVLLNDRNQSTMTQNLVDEMQRQEEQAAGLAGRPVTPWNVRVMRNYRFWDRDAHAIFFVLNETGFLRERLNLTTGYLRDLMERRAPALPPWLVEGVLELSRTMALEPYADATFIMESRSRLLIPGGVVKIGNAQWISAAETAGIKRGHAPAMPSLISLLTAPPPDPGSPAFQVWRAQAALFVRWTLDGNKAPRREALWQLLRQADLGPLTAAHFQACFGIDGTEADAQLRRYLPQAIRRSFELRPVRFADFPDYVLRPAGDAEISRVKGDLDRHMIKYVREFFPPLLEKYIDQARRTLRRAYEQEERDPRLIGLIGLCECDAGDDKAARAWLEEAVAGGVVRPRVYWELARIRYQAVLVRKEKGPPDERWLQEVVGLLDIARTQAPPQAAVYELLAEIWQKHTISLTPAQLAALDEGLHYFPQRVGLVTAVARLKMRQSLSAESRALVERGIGLTSDPERRRQLLELQAELAAENESAQVQAEPEN